jgi:ribosomal protein S18 acetylase RimI-like enzyme
MADASETGAQHIGTFWMLELDRPLPPAIIPRVPATFTRTGPEAAQELAQAMGFDNPEIVLQRLAAGRHCYTARVNGSLAAYGWVTFDEEAIGELGLIFRLKAGEAYIWDCATLPAYRRQRLYSALLAYIVRELRAAGLCRVWIGADMDNLPSQSGMILAGFQPAIDLFMDSAQSMRLCARPGIPEQVVMDVRHALFKNQDS